MKKFSVVLASLLFGLSAASVTQAQPQAMGACLTTEIVEFDGNVVDAAVATPALSTLVDAVTAAGLGEALATTENITVYAPTNDAFAAIPDDILNTFLGDVDLLTAVLTYHVTPGVMADPRRFVSPVRRPTLQGQWVFYHRSGGEPRVNQAGVSCQGVKTDNGMVWVIDSVLLPQL